MNLHPPVRTTVAGQAPIAERVQRKAGASPRQQRRRASAPARSTRPGGRCARRSRESKRLERFDTEEIAGLKDRSSRPRTQSSRLPPGHEAMVLRLRFTTQRSARALGSPKAPVARALVRDGRSRFAPLARGVLAGNSCPSTTAPGLRTSGCCPTRRASRERLSCAGDRYAERGSTARRVMTDNGSA